MPIVARCNGTVLVQENDRLGVAEQGGGGLPTAIFVAGLLAVIPLGAGVAFLFMDLRIAAVLLAVSIPGIAAAIGLSRQLRRRRAAATPVPWLVFDRTARAVVDRNGAEIAPLDRVRLERAWQAASSSRALVVRYPGGSVVIARGNPFGDSVDAVEQALRAYGVG